MDSLRFVMQNAGWAALHPSEANAARRAMRKYRKDNPRCEVTGTDKKIQIHHIRPVWAAPELAADPSNFIALSSQAHIHIIFGHAGNFSRRYVDNVKEIAEKVRLLRDTAVVVHRYPEDQNFSPSMQSTQNTEQNDNCKRKWRIFRYLCTAFLVILAILLFTGCATKYPGGRADLWTTETTVHENVVYTGVGVRF